MKLPTPREMAALERQAQDQYGVTAAALMERAGACTAEVARRLLRSRGGQHLEILDARALDGPGLDRLLREADLLIDAIFGTGFRGPAEGTAAQVIEAANRSGTPILAVDVPSGADAGAGRVEEPCIRAAATVTMGLPKLGLVQYPAAAYAGRLFVADIGFPAALVEEAPIAAWLVLATWVDRALPRRPPDSHKGRF